MNTNTDTNVSHSLQLPTKLSNIIALLPPLPEVPSARLLHPAGQAPDPGLPLLPWQPRLQPGAQPPPSSRWPAPLPPHLPLPGFSAGVGRQQGRSHHGTLPRQQAGQLQEADPLNYRQGTKCRISSSNTWITPFDVVVVWPSSLEDLTLYSLKLDQLKFKYQSRFFTMRH